MPVRVFDERELGLLKEVLDSGKLSGLSGGQMTSRFEAAFAEALGARFGVAMNSAMSVLHSCVIAAGAGAPTFHSIAHGLHFNYRMTEQTAAIGVGQLERAHGYVAELVEIGRLYDQAVEDCPWITIQRGPEEATHACHLWGATFQGEKAGIPLDDFKGALREAECGINLGYTQMPAYRHPLIRERLGYGGGCPLDCPLYEGTQNRYPEDLCPQAEYVMPRIMASGTFGPKEQHEVRAERLRRAIEGA